MLDQFRQCAVAALSSARAVIAVYETAKCVKAIRLKGAVVRMEIADSRPRLCGGARLNLRWRVESVRWDDAGMAGDR